MLTDLVDQVPRDHRSLAPAQPVVPFARDLARFGRNLAVVTDDGTEVSYEDLAARVASVAARLGTPSSGVDYRTGHARRLVLVAVSNDLDPLVAYLAALAAGHPVLLTSGADREGLDALTATYDPDVVFAPSGSGWAMTERRPGSVHELHPDLAVLLSTSGSTGSAKTVRLSHDNLQSNAEAIAGYLDIRPTDRAAVSLPMHYCYGLSVVHSHLLRGAGLLLTNRSVVDRCFWDGFRRHHGTSLAGVPYTFDLLDRIDFESVERPTLRYLTQAGGRMAPEQVRRFAEMGRRQGWDLFVMYGQTEATARMAYLPPTHTLAHPDAVGVPIAGGSLALEPVEDAEAGVGELVYSGPNVMLGYAEGPDDLAQGRTVEVLRTGDLARRTADGLYRIVGRRSRFLKLYGLRIDLGQVERVLADQGDQGDQVDQGDRAWSAVCTGDDDGLVVAVPPDVPAGDVPRLLGERFGLPARAIAVVTVDEIPRLPSGKPDHRRILTLARTRPVPSPAGPAGPERSGVAPILAEVLGVTTVAPDATFVSLGGDSLSYVELSIRLEQALGYVPDAWPTMRVAELDALEPRRRRLHRIETSVVLRALAIVVIAGSHIGVFHLRGGAHVLLAVAGYNFARFRLAATESSDRLRHWLGSVARIALPAMTYIGAWYVFADGYSLGNLTLVNNYVTDGVWRYWYWFVEVLVHVLLALALLFSIPAVRRWERRQPFGCALVALVVALAVRGIGIDAPADHTFTTHSVAWIFALGWAAQRAAGVRQQVLLSLATLVLVPGFFGDAHRETVIALGLLVVVWVRQVPVPWPLNRLAGLLAGASFAIYLVHWRLYELFLEWFPRPKVVWALTLASGIAAWFLARWIARGAQHLWSRVAPVLALALTPKPVDRALPLPPPLSTPGPSTPGPHLEPAPSGSLV